MMEIQINQCLLENEGSAEIIHQKSAKMCKCDKDVMNDLTKTEHEVMSLVDSMQNFLEKKWKKCYSWLQ